MVDAFAQDIVTRIVDVHWGGAGPFVAADNFCHVFYGIPTPKDPTKPPDPNDPKDFEDLGILDFHDGEIFGGACGTITRKDENNRPIQEFVFVLVGNWINHDIEVGDNQRPQGPMIMASKDGRTWTVAYKDTETDMGRDDNFYSNSETFYGAVYEEKDGTGAFYAASYYWDFVLDDLSFPHVNEGERLYKSSDGFTWAKVGEQMKAGINTGMWSEDDPSLLVPHCTKPQNEGKAVALGETPKKIPDGLQGYNEGADTFIKPLSLDKYSIFGALYDPNPPENKVNITQDAHAPYPRDVGMPCMCVANNGDIWIAGGGKSDAAPHGRLDASFDGGETWVESFRPEKADGEAEANSGRTIMVVLAKTQPPAAP